MSRADGLEDAVDQMDAPGCGPDRLAHQNAESIRSTAISLKRIADALTVSARLPDSVIAAVTGNAIAAVINRAITDALAAPLNQYGEGIGECIQGQLERGQR